MPRLDLSFILIIWLVRLRKGCSKTVPQHPMISTSCPSQLIQQHSLTCAITKRSVEGQPAPGGLGDGILCQLYIAGEERRGEEEQPVPDLGARAHKARNLLRCALDSKRDRWLTRKSATPLETCLVYPHL
eukprot:670998-Pelagomonas_calceolata.AAC.1